MLRVKTKLAASQINGLGLFAAESIPANTVVWERFTGVDVLWLPQEVEALPLLWRNYLRHFCLFEGGGYLLCGDNARFINHATNANTCHADNSGYVLIAARDISEGKEITENYLVTESDYPFDLAG